MISIECTSSIIGRGIIDSISLYSKKEIEILCIEKEGFVIEKGRNKGSIAKNDFVIINGNFDNILDYLLLNEKLINGCKVSIVLNIAYNDQCNFDVSIDQMKKIVEIGISLNITCYEESGLSEDHCSKQ